MKKIFGIFLLLLLSGCGIDNDDELTECETGYVAGKTGCELVEDEDNIIDLFDLDDLIAEYDDLEAANLKYAGTELTISSVVITNLGTPLNDNSYLSLIGSVGCTYSGDDEELLEIDKNMRIIIKGTVQNVTEQSGYIHLNDCELVEVITTPEIITTAEELTDLDISDLIFQVVEISGTVQSIEQTVLTSKSIILENSEYDAGIDIQFSNLIESIIDQVSEVEALDQVTILCVVMPYSTGDLGMLLFGFDVQVIE